MEIYLGDVSLVSISIPDIVILGGKWGKEPYASSLGEKGEYK